MKKNKKPTKYVRRSLVIPEDIWEEIKLAGERNCRTANSELVFRLRQNMYRG